MTETLAVENPFVTVFGDAEETGGENGAATLEQPTDLIGFACERTVVCNDFECMDATAIERV